MGEKNGRLGNIEDAQGGRMKLNWWENPMNGRERGKDKKCNETLFIGVFKQ